ncbi:ATP-binding protein [Teredinibacter turnerae]|uniref:ATP-binding protein n=1 Tax=Teredinibacter turnerae TaxID=2426 RepID=UPI00040E14B5|nr:ATP-binding protein [Teredinibacter turnerae]
MKNPFVFNAASTLDSELLLRMFISDHNYSRFIESKRNVFLWGERGCGKTMTLLYNKIALQKKANELASQDSVVEYIPVYVSCITPLTFKREHLLLEDEFKAAVISEHYFSLSIALALVESIIEIPKIVTFFDESSLGSDLEYIFDRELPSGENSLLRLKRFLTKQFILTQKEINKSDSDSFYDDTFTFTSIVIPLIELFTEAEKLKKTHFVFMMDDAHDLNIHQRSALNSWIAYRDNSTFSFKVSAAKTPEYSLSTTSGGAILPGHDYVNVDIEQPYQNNDSAFGQLARKIIAKRLELFGIQQSPEDFFPINSSMIKDLENSKSIALDLANNKYQPSERKSINDFVYKYTRAIYFRTRSSKANRPPYSGLETIIHLSSGVIRNLLEPCYVMFDDMVSKGSLSITGIAPAVQTDAINRLSDSYWKRLRDGIDNEIDGCTAETAKHVENLFNGLAELFRSRLLDESCSEPRAIAFTISAKSDEIMGQLLPILGVARRAQLLYVRSGSAKDQGAKEDYYIPNKMLWPSRGLDPVGQHARVSIQAGSLVDCALNKTSIPYKSTKEIQLSQPGLFDND